MVEVEESIDKSNAAPFIGVALGLEMIGVPPERPYPDRGMTARATKHAACCPIRVAVDLHPGDWTSSRERVTFLPVMWASSVARVSAGLMTCILERTLVLPDS